MAEGEPSHVPVHQVEGHGKDTEDHEVRDPVDGQHRGEQEEPSKDYKDADQLLLPH